MAEFKECVLTQKGMALLAKVQAGLCSVVLTKAASGDGSYSDGEDLTARTALKSQKQAFPIDTVTVQNSTNVYVKFTITNHPAGGTDLEHGYYIKEVGVFATDPDDGEILYCIAIAETDKWDYMPAYNDLLPSTNTVEILAEVTNASTVTIEAPNFHYLYDDDTGDKYILGIKNGLMYYEEVTE